MYSNDWNRSGNADISDDMINSMLVKESSNQEQNSKRNEYLLPNLLMSFCLFSGLIYQVLFFLFTGKLPLGESVILFFVMWFVLSVLTFVICIWICKKIKKKS